MNRFWIRQSILITALMLLVMLPTAFALKLVVSSFTPPSVVQEFEAYERSGIPLPLLAIMAVSVVIGAVVGIIASRSLSRPITFLVEGVRQIGSGKLGHQIQLKSSTQEFDELAAAINTMSRELNDAENQRRRMMADVAHELRTPLTVLEGHLRAALDNVYALEGAQIANLYGQTHQLIKLVDDLNLLSKAEAHRLPLNIERVDVEQVMQEVVGNFQLVANEKDITITLNTSALQPTVLGDIIRLRQVFSNLIDNAIQYTPNNGNIHVTLVEKSDSLQIGIADDGTGIAPDHLPYIFDRFYRTDVSRTRNTGGSGLGLAIVKALVEVQGGKLTVQSEGEREGTTFFVFFPLAPQTQTVVHST